MNRFNIAGIPRLIFGAGKITELSKQFEKYGKKVLLVTGGSSLKKSGTYKKILDSLKNFDVFEATIAKEPSPKEIDKIVFDNLNNKIDVVCAIGGGSVLDAGKAVSAMLKQKDFITVKKYLEIVGSENPSGEKVPFIAVPTTSGTGSEATKNAVISEPGKNGFKSSLRHDNYIPDLAIIDPELILDCPVYVTAASGLDALSQLIESYLSNNSNTFTDSLAGNAIIKMLNSLVFVCTENPEDIELRSNIAYSAFISGITLAHAGLGTVHGMAGFIGGYKDIPHGVLCGALLPHWLEVTVDIMIENQNLYNVYLQKISDISKYIIRSDESQNTAKLFVEYIKNLCFTLNLPGLKTFGITEEELEYFAKKSNNKNNPVPLSFEEKLNILKKSF